MKPIFLKISPYRMNLVLWCFLGASLAVIGHNIWTWHYWLVISLVTAIQLNQIRMTKS